MFDNFLPKYITAKNVVFLLVAILFVILIFQISEIALLFFASFVIACSLEPLVQKLTGKFSRNCASAIVLSGFLLIIISFFAAIFIIGGTEIKEFMETFPQYIENLKNFINSSSFMNKLSFSQIDFGGIISSASGFTSKLVEETIHAGINIGSGIVYLIVSILIVYYLLSDKDKIRAATLKMFPTQMRTRTGEIIDTISKKSGGYIIAQVVTMASVGVVVTIGLLLLKSDYAFILGLISAVFDIVPVIGPAVAFLICLIVMYKSGAVVLILTAIIFAAAQLIENNFVRPYVFGKFLDLHPLIIYLFLFIAAKYMGVIGVIFAPAIAATTVVLIEEIYMKSLE